MAAPSFLFLLILAAASSVDCSSQSSNRSCFLAERAALLSFKAGIRSDPANLLDSWQQGHRDCCRWRGVTCSSRTGHIVKLDLRNRFPSVDAFYGDGPDEQHSLCGEVSSSLLSLRHSLRHLDLSGNVVLGDAMAMPEFLGSLQSLTYLNLSNMGFHGRVPPQLGNLSKLVQLDMGNTYGYSTIHSKDISWLGLLYSLEFLDMSVIDLSGVGDWVHTINALSNCAVLILAACGLTMSNAPTSLPQHNLTVLKELDLSYNSFNRLAARNWFWDITSLKSLKLSDCGLSGTFPDELGNWTLLETFDVSYNNINGMIPGTMQTLCNIRSLSLNGNNIGGDITEVVDRIPSCSWKNLQELNLMQVNITGTTLQSLSSLTSLRVLRMSRNKLSGSVLGEISTLTNLTWLSLGNNNLSCLVPVDIGKLTNLSYLFLENNSLSGLISEDHLDGLMNLKSIDLSDNNLEFIIDSHWLPPFNLDSAYFTSCHLGPQFPNWLRWQKSTIDLDISNTSLVGRIPDWFWTTFSEATSLDISLNQLTGELPVSLEFMSAITLSMQSNLLTGLIPRLPKKVKLLDVSRNSLNGFASNFRAPDLQIAIMFSNSITGTIPTSICQMRELRVLDLSNNMLSEQLCDCGGKELKQWNPSINNSSRVNSMSSSIFKLTTLLLSNNSISSGFPLFLRQCKNLVFLDLTQNKFTGPLPTWIREAIPGLVMLRLRSNTFSGHIPSQIMELGVISILDLSNNNFSGAIPQYLEKMNVLTGTTTPLSENPFQEMFGPDYNDIDMGLFDGSFSVVIKGQVLEYKQNVIYLMSIDLSRNSLTGEIPEELSSLAGLINLNLSSNSLSGNIPYNICNLHSLESLDLSKNTFGGGIPQSLTNLTYLSYLNLSYNNLSGRIPSGHQLDILKVDDPASLYIGNPGLCGHPVPRQCPGPPGDLPVNGDSARWSEDSLCQMDFLLGSIIGFVAGTWMVFCGLLFIKWWRCAYFGLLDKSYDRLHVISVVTWLKWFRNTGRN